MSFSVMEIMNQNYNHFYQKFDHERNLKKLITITLITILVTKEVEHDLVNDRSKIIYKNSKKIFG